MPTDKPKKKSRLDKWIKISGFIATILAITIAFFTLSERVPQIFNGNSTTYLRGIVKNSAGEPIVGAIITIDSVPTDTVRTTSDGGFYFEKIPGKVGDRVRVYVSKEGHMGRNKYVTLPGPAKFELKQEHKNE